MAVNLYVAAGVALVILLIILVVRVFSSSSSAVPSSGPFVGKCAGVSCANQTYCEPVSGKCVALSAPKTIMIRNRWPFAIKVYAARPDGPKGQQIVEFLKPTPVAAGEDIVFTIPINSPSIRVGFLPINITDANAHNSNYWYSWWEATIGGDGKIWSNLSYVDSVSVQLKYEMIGGYCTASDQAACVPPSGTFNVSKFCPEALQYMSENGFLSCMSPRTFCDPPYKTKPGWNSWCHPTAGGPGQSIMAELRKCCAAGSCTAAQCAGNTTPQNIWACSGPFAEDSPRCAMLNRGLFTEGTGKTYKDANPTYLAKGCVAEIEKTAYECQEENFYKHPPFNNYCDGIHNSPYGCPGNYCFAFDDQGAKSSGSHACRGTSTIIALYNGVPP